MLGHPTTYSDANWHTAEYIQLPWALTVRREQPRCGMGPSINK